MRMRGREFAVQSSATQTKEGQMRRIRFKPAAVLGLVAVLALMAAGSAVVRIPE